MKATLWARTRMFVDAHAAKIGLVLVVVVAAGAVAGVRWEARHRAEGIEAEAMERADAIQAAARERRVQICTEARHLRELVSELIDTAVEPTTGGVRFDEVPSFAAMPASVQQFLHDYAAAQAGGEAGPDLAERLRAFQETRLGELPAFCT